MRNCLWPGKDVHTAGQRMAKAMSRQVILAQLVVRLLCADPLPTVMYSLLLKLRYTLW